MLSGWAMEMRTRSKMIIAVLILFSGQLLILALGLLWQRAIIPIEETVEATLIRLGPGLLIKTALGSLVLVILSRVVAALTKVKHSTTPDAN
jgi:biotin transporter BioY